jgi:GntR family transcriptional regulator
VAAELRGTLSGMPATKRLPTEAELCRAHGVSRQTVRRAYQELVADGLVDRVPGRGTFPAPPSGSYVRSFGTIEDLMALSEDTEMEVVRPLQLAAGSPRARADLGAGQVMEVWVRRLHAGAPFCVTIVSLPVSFAPALRRSVLMRRGGRQRTTVLQLLETRLQRYIADALQEATVDRLPAEVAPLIEMQAWDSALRIDRVYRDQDGDAIESTLNYFNPARYTYRLELRRGRRG